MPGRNRNRKINIKAQQSAFNKAIETKGLNIVRYFHLNLCFNGFIKSTLLGFDIYSNVTHFLLI